MLATCLKQLRSAHIPTAFEPVFYAAHPTPLLLERARTVSIAVTRSLKTGEHSGYGQGAKVFL